MINAISAELIAAFASVTVFLAAISFLIYKRWPKKIKTDFFVNQWKELQKHCRDKNTWPQAIIEADRLLNKALAKNRFKGKSMGEKMVAAQRTFTNNDAIWFAHNLSKKIMADPGTRLKESEVKEALVAFRQGLRDLGALPNEKI